jgi:predicted acylesterase/phospholipase RssA
VTKYPLNPPLDCDLIMKGGVTSGVIYPGAICELATEYRLRSVGGASAGAIAAAAAAAAEYGRASGGFEKLERLPQDLGRSTRRGGSTLFRLFQPTKATAGLFALLTSTLGGSRFWRPLKPAAVAVLRFGWGALIGVLPGALVLGLGLAGSGVAGVTAIVTGALLALVGAPAGGFTGAVLRVRALAGQGFGLCSGMPGPQAYLGTPALTPWLHGLLQDLAGRGPDDPPLTFGDLTSAGCTLRMMTTNLNRRQPVALPWAERTWYFDPAVFRTLFPAPVVDWMIAHPPPPREGSADRRRHSELRREQALPLRPLPAAADLPVVVATRMSLSFPFLISAIPLHAIDHTRPDNQPARQAADALHTAQPSTSPQKAAALLGKPVLDVNWFSDGGICNNLPVHFFDHPIPRWPTFAIDLTPFPPGREKSLDETENSLLPKSNQGGVHRRSTVFAPNGFAAIGGFAGSILAAARSWFDESLLVMPGYRDRVVTVWHDGKEGGLNLTMDVDAVKALSDRGRGGARKLVDRFAGDQPGTVAAEGWRNQQWIRLRASVRGLDEWVDGFAEAFDEPAGPGPYTALAGGRADGEVPSYPLTQGRRARFNARVDDVRAVAADWAADAGTVEHHVPSPAPVLRLMPSDRSAPGDRKTP